MHAVKRIDACNGGTQEEPMTIPGLEQLVLGSSLENIHSVTKRKQLLAESLTHMPAFVDRLVSLHDGA